MTNSARRLRLKTRPAFGVVILGAGTSSRMGRPKLLLPWGGASDIGHLLHQRKRLGVRQIAVVCRADDKPLMDELDLLRFLSLLCVWVCREASSVEAGPPSR
jgi:CTP:molybdopterin cytidylyltransferase MocA